MNPFFVPLHVHTAEGSIGDSILRVADYIEKAKEQKLRAVAVTDHGSLSVMYRFHKACRDEGIKPIIGCEVYETDDRTDNRTEEDAMLWRKKALLCPTRRSNFNGQVQICIFLKIYLSCI